MSKLAAQNSPALTQAAKANAPATKLSAKEQALADTANAKAHAKGTDTELQVARAKLAKRNAVLDEVDAMSAQRRAKRSKVDPATTAEAIAHAAHVLTAPAAAKRATEEAKAKEANAAKLAQVVRKQQPAKVLETGSGALVGVAKGAVEGQPHTKQAVKEANARARAALANPRLAETLAQIAKLEAEALDTPLLVAGTTFATPAKAAARRATVLQGMRAYADRLAASPPKAKEPRTVTATPAPAPKAKAKAKPAPKATAKAATPDTTKLTLLTKTNPYREDTKAHATFELFRTCKTVGDVRAKVDATGGSGAAGKYDAGYLRYSARDGYIKVG